MDISPPPAIIQPAIDSPAAPVQAAEFQFPTNLNSNCVYSPTFDQQIEARGKNIFSDPAGSLVVVRLSDRTFFALKGEKTVHELPARYTVGNYRLDGITETFEFDDISFSRTNELACLTVTNSTAGDKPVTFQLKEIPLVDVYKFECETIYVDPKPKDEYFGGRDALLEYERSLHVVSLTDSVEKGKGASHPPGTLLHSR